MMCCIARENDNVSEYTTQCLLRSDSDTLQNKKVVYMKHKLISSQCTQEERGVLSEECGWWEATCQNSPNQDSSLSAMVSPATIGTFAPSKIPGCPDTGGLLGRCCQVERSEPYQLLSSIPQGKETIHLHSMNATFLRARKPFTFTA
jgi:hypothetical protein